MDESILESIRTICIGAALLGSFAGAFYGISRKHAKQDIEEARQLYSDGKYGDAYRKAYYLTGQLTVAVPRKVKSEAKSLVKSIEDEFVPDIEAEARSFLEEKQEGDIEHRISLISGRYITPKKKLPLKDLSHTYREHFYKEK